MGGALGGARRRLGHRARQRDRTRDHRRGAREPRLHRERDDRVRRVSRGGRALHARLRGARDRRAGGRDPHDGARVRPRAPRDDLLDARDHRASQRGRQRAGAGQSVVADRSRRPLRLRAQSAARAEQRPGRRRHGGLARSVARVPARRERRAEDEVRSGVEGARSPTKGMAPLADVRGDGARRSSGALRHRREPAPVRGRSAPRSAPARGPRVSPGAGPVSHQDRGAGARRPARERGMVRVRGHRDQQRAPGAARAQGDRGARGRARRSHDLVRPGQAPGSRLGPAGLRDDLERGARPLADACRHELRAAREARRAPVAVLRRRPPGRALPPQPSVGAADSWSAGRIRPGRARSPRRPARRRVSAAPHHGTEARRVQHRRAELRLSLADASWREPRRVPRGRRPLWSPRGRGRSGAVAPRRGRSPHPP